MLMMRFDMRVPDKSPAEIADQYECAIQMAQWVEGKAPAMLGLSEHHAAEDGYMPSPLVLAGSMAAVTSKLPIMIAATLMPLYDPVRLVEEMIMLDHISRGRVSYVFGLGYRKTEYDLFDLEFGERGKIADEKLARVLSLITEAKTATRMPRITPPPFSADGPPLMWGGGSKAAARRAGRNGLSFLGQVDAPGIKESYEKACKDAGHPIGMCIVPPADMPNIVFVHPNPDEGWEEVGPYLLKDAASYAEWNNEAGLTAASLSQAKTIDDMKKENGAYRVVDVKGALQLIKTWGRLPLHPLCGGVPPELGWTYLKRAVEEVMPHLAA